MSYFISILLLITALKQGKQEVGLSPKHVTKAIMKHVKEDVIPAPPEEVMRVSVCGGFQALSTNTRSCQLSSTCLLLESISQQLMNVLVDAILLQLFQHFPPEFAVPITG